jgi:hypothetical protein
MMTRSKTVPLPQSGPGVDSAAERTEYTAGDTRGVAQLLIGRRFRDNGVHAYSTVTEGLRRRLLVP